MTLNPPLETGEYIRNFTLPSTQGTPEKPLLSPNDLVGRPLLVFFFLSDEAQSDLHELSSFRDVHEQLKRLGIVVMGIGLQSREAQAALAAKLNLPFPLLSDASAETCAGYGVLRPQTVDGKPAIALSRTTYLFGPDFTVLRAYLDVGEVNHAVEVLADAKTLLLREEPRDIVQHAPVLIIPNVLPADLRKTLIELWQTENDDSGFMKQIDGKTVGVTDYGHKIRRDHYIAAGAVQNRVQTYLASRVVPQIAKAFNYAVTRREDLRIACYDSSRGGYFRPHRDNTTDGTAHRRFAMSLLLNDDYEGGYLRFPEYGQHRYRPDPGGAVIFSCSLLHEATDVTAGQRFVLLSFFYGEAEAKAREAYNRRTGGTYRA